MKNLYFSAIRQSFFVLLIAFYISGCGPHPNIDPPPYSDMDKFMDELAKRVSSKFNPLGNQKDFIVVPTQAEYPVGTLLHANSTIPVDYTACIPNRPPLTVTTPNLFPEYDLTNGVAFSVGLDNAAIKKLADFGIDITDKDTISYNVKSSDVRMLDETTVLALKSDNNCGSKSGSGPIWLVRGYVDGQREFSTKNEEANKFKGKIEKIGSFTIDFGSGDATLKVSDDGTTGFLQIISALNETPAGVVRLSAPTRPTSGGRIYVQQDLRDAPNAGQQIVKTLAGSGFTVEKRVELIDSSKMPKNAQVRYFNDSDKGLAEAALTELQKLYKTAILARIAGMPAPKGQLEVWLPRFIGIGN